MTVAPRTCERCGSMYAKRYSESVEQWEARRFCSTGCYQPSLEERLWSRVATGSAGECWPWTGAVTSTGHGTIRTAHGALGVHRVAYELEHGPIPDGLVVHHDCRNQLCCNSAHMRLMTRGEHIRLHDAGAYQRERTHCKNGHEFDEANTLWRGGTRLCRTCGRERMRKHRERKRDLVGAPT